MAQKFYDELTLGPRASMERTREGFLLCRDVALARTGQQTYSRHEVPGLPVNSQGQFVIDRPDSEVFSEAAMASFRGKSVTDDHPWEDVDPRNYKDHLIGTILDPRRGTGDKSHCMVSDIIIYDAKAIAKIESGKRELSCGYDADYRDVRPGYGVQTNIRGNHVSLVDQGRCGAACSIRDRSMFVARETTKKPLLPKRFTDALRGVVRARDSEDDDAVRVANKELDDAIEEMDKPGEPDVEQTGGKDINVTVNLDGGKARDAEPGEAGGQEAGDKMCSKEDLDAAVAAAVASATQAMQAKVDDLQAQLSAMAEDVGAATDPDDVSTQDAVSRALTLKPGLQVPALDSKPGSKSHRDSVTNLKRRALSESFQTRDGRAAIGYVYGPGVPDFAKMSEREVDLVFRNSSQVIRDASTASTADTLLQTASAGVVRDADGTRRVLDSASWGAEIRKHYGRAA